MGGPDEKDPRAGKGGRELPRATRRLFPERLPDPEEHAPFVIARLLEDGDSEDLRWLVGRYGEERLRSWLARHGSRRLSRRSRRFWELVLDRRAGSEAPTAGDLWPL